MSKLASTMHQAFGSIKPLCRGIILSALITPAILVVGCSSPETSDSTVRYWRTLTGAAGDAQDELVARFNDSQSSYEVAAEFQGGYADLAAKLMTASISGSGPDVTQLGTFEIRQFAKAGLLVDLTPFIVGDVPLEVSDWPETMLDGGRVDDGIYWLPFNVTAPLLYYNPGAFSAVGADGPPKTWDEFFEFAERLTQRDEEGRVERAGVALWNITWPLLSIIWSEGGELTNSDYTNITLDDPVAVDVLKKIQALIVSGVAIMPDKASGGHRTAFMSGRAAMILDSPAPYDEIMKNAVGFEPKVAQYPGGKNGFVYAPGGGGVAMLASCPPEKREAAWSFMHFLLGPVQIAYYAERSGYLAFSEAAWELAGDLHDDPSRVAMHEALAHVRADYSVTMSPAVRNAFDKAFQQIVVGRKDVLESLQRADAEAERDIEEER